MILPLDRRARRTGRALLKLQTTAAMDAVVASLHGQPVGSRFLEARRSGEREWQAQAQARAKLSSMDRAPQSYSGALPQDSCLRMPSDHREIVLLCHVGEAASRGMIDLNNLPSGRVDVLARATSAAFFVSHGVRTNVRLWLMMRDVGVTLCCDGATVRGLHPDERTIAASMRRALRAEGVVHGWSVHREERLADRLRALGASCAGAGGGGGGGGGGGAEVAHSQLLVLHELGCPLTPAMLARGDGRIVASPAGPSGAASRILVLGDHKGFTTDDEACFESLGGVRICVSPLPLLASHCIVLAHGALDAYDQTREGNAAGGCAVPD
jgi:tRNA (pseudouridine54-N1)-methyltransferase